MIDNVHEPIVIRKTDNDARAIYPFLVEAGISLLRHYVGVTPETDIIDQIREAAAAQGVNQTTLAKVAGLPSQSAISNVFKRKRKLTLTEADTLKRYLGIENTPQVQWVPLIGLASAGSWAEAVPMAARAFPVPLRTAGNRAFAVEIVGDSMNLVLPEGGWAVVDPDQRHLYAGKIYLIQNEEHEVTVKRYAGDPARFEPVSDNPLHQPLTLDTEPFTVIGRIVSYGRSEGL